MVGGNPHSLLAVFLLYSLPLSWCWSFLSLETLSPSLLPGWGPRTTYLVYRPLHRKTTAISTVNRLALTDPARALPLLVWFLCSTHRIPHYDTDSEQDNKKKKKKAKQRLFRLYLLSRYVRQLQLGSAHSCFLNFEGEDWWRRLRALWKEEFPSFLIYRGGDDI